MTTAYWCVLVAGCLPYLWVALAKSKPDYDNNAPREFLARAEGWRKRANYAQVNAFENFPLFAAAVIIAHLTRAPQEGIELHAELFILFRIIHGIAYIADMGVLRSMAWTAGFVCAVRLFFLAP